MDVKTSVWRENYLEGPLLGNVSAEDFERIRAAFLYSCVPEYPGETLLLFCCSCMPDRMMLQHARKNKLRVSGWSTRKQMFR